MSQFLALPQDIDEAGATARLVGEEARHLTRVMRLSVGDAVRVFDGKGRRFQGVLARAEAREAWVERLVALPANEPPGALHLLQGLLKGDRWEWFLEKAVELGATRITPIVAARSVPRLDGDRGRGKRERWEKILLAAAKQCERGMIPALDEPGLLAAALAALGAATPTEVRRACVERRDAKPLGAVPKGGVLRLALGPEGGFAPEEEDALVAAGFVTATLGSRILRGETAALAALALTALPRRDEPGSL